MTKYELLKDLVKSGCDIDKLSIKTKNFLETMSGDCDYTLVQTPKIKLNNLATKQDDPNTKEYVWLGETGCNNTKQPFHNMERIHDMIHNAVNVYSGASDDERYKMIDELPLAYLVANSDNAVFLGYSKDNKYQYYNITSHGVVKFDSYSVNKYVKQMHDRYMDNVKYNFDQIYAEEIKNNTWQERCEIGE